MDLEEYGVLEKLVPGIKWQNNETIKLKIKNVLCLLHVNNIKYKAVEEITEL